MVNAKSVNSFFIVFLLSNKTNEIIPIISSVEQYSRNPDYLKRFGADTRNNSPSEMIIKFVDNNDDLIRKDHHIYD